VRVKARRKVKEAEWALRRPFTFHFSPFHASLRYLLFAICYSAQQDPASMADHHPPNTHPHTDHGAEPMP
jgi:hypothetical protein